MGTENQVQIHRVIVHKVDHKQFDEPQLSDLESVIDDAVASFLRRHIADSRTHKYARTAVFEDEEGFCAICDRLLGDGDQFVSQSRAIATHLFQTVKDDRRISPSDLVVCTYSEPGEAAQRLALLKMDPEEGFVGRQRTIGEKVQFVFDSASEVLPTGNLQKCAFVLPPALRDGAGYHLRVLDQQATRYGGYRLVASFFVTDFLQCKVGLEPQDRTRTFVVLSHEWLGRVKDTWPEADVQRFTRQVRGALEGEEIDVEAFSRGAIRDVEEQGAYVGYLLERGQQELTFAPDPAERERLAKYTWFEGDHGLRVRVESDAVGPGKTLQVRHDDVTHTYTITIRTHAWREQLKGGSR
ncbi:MAG: nucleoid-associated protein [Anaerolineae bacterium]